jgi:hypothetical protein
MDNIQVIDVVSGVHFMPSWEFTAREVGTDQVQIDATWDTVNSNHDQAVQGYPQKVSLIRSLGVFPSHFRTKEELYGALVMWLVEIQIHETREFFRVGWNMEAPFHPHKPKGEDDWNRAMQGDAMMGAIPLGL